MNDILNFDLDPGKSSIIKVIGVGGGGSNAVNHMFHRGIKDVNFVVCNTDAQALNSSPVSVKLQLGASLTLGRGAGSKPEVGRMAAEESIDEIKEILQNNTSMVFITAGMGGGTGTGAAPVIAKTSKSMGILTVGIVTIPFSFEGPERINQAIKGITEMQDHVDSLLVVSNDKLREIFGNLAISEAFSRADDVLATAAKGIAEIITVPGYVNVDFADVETVMKDSGVAVMGSGMAEGENRAVRAIEAALASPLLNNNEIRGAKSILLNFTFGENELTMDEVTEVTDYIIASANRQMSMIWGMGSDPSLGEKLNVTIIATGFEMNSIPELYVGKKKVDFVPLRDEKSHSNVNQPVSNPTQQAFPFEFEQKTQEEYILLDQGREQEEAERARKMAERVRNLKETHEQLKAAGYSSSTPENEIERLEKEPAFKRNKIDLSTSKKPESDDISRYRLSEDESEGPRLRKDNSYLHDKPD